MDENEEETITLVIPKRLIETLIDQLQKYDCGPTGEGWFSDDLYELQIICDGQIPSNGINK